MNAGNVVTRLKNFFIVEFLTHKCTKGLFESKKLIKVVKYFADTARITLSLSQTLDGALIRKGDTVYLHCEVRANPAVHTVEWSRNKVR